jgi:hypothetical protein
MGRFVDGAIAVAEIPNNPLVPKPYTPPNRP